MESTYLNQDETLDTIFQGIKVIQKKRGYRFSLDAILLAHFTNVKKGDHVVDLGTGSGIIPLILAKRSEADKILGVDIQDRLVEMAARNVELNYFTDKIDIVKGDIRNLKDDLEPESFDLVLSNPPYRKIRSGRVNPHPEKAIARHEIKSSLQEVLETARILVKFRGRVTIIYPASRLVDLFFHMRSKKLEPKMLRIVYPDMQSKGNLAIVEAMKGGSEGILILEPIFVYDLNGDYSDEMKKILTMP